MSTPRRSRVALTALPLAATLLLAATPARGAAAHTASVPPTRTTLAPSAEEPDTTLEGYLRTLTDSTDAHFGPVALPPDTTGLDSARMAALARPYDPREHEKHSFSWFPVASFNRVDGPVLGAGAGIGRTGSIGKLDGRLATATGPNLMLGWASGLKVVDRGAASWSLRLAGGRRTVTMVRETIEPRLTALRAFINGSDRNHYVQRDGVLGKLTREGETLRLGVTWRDMLESPRATTATWNLAGSEPEVVDNLPAWRGWVREFELEGIWRAPGTPVTAQTLYASSSRAAGSDFEYRRTVVTASADIGLGRAFALVPQLGYGALTGEPLPQESFYLGGTRTLRSVPGESLGGTRSALARCDLFAVRDLLAAARIPHPAAFPMQASVFGAVGSVWGTDPYGGPPRPGGDWPHAEDWRSEVGFALVYQPGVPEPEEFLRLNVAFPLGPGGNATRVSVSVTRALDLVRPFEQ